MATDFFQQQDKARRNTKLLVFYFIMAVLTLIVLTYLLCAAIFLYPNVEDVDEVGQLWNLPLLIGVVGGVLLLVGGASAFKMAELASGGRAVALMLNGEEIAGNTRNPYQRRLLNIVEEMAIASGVPMPAVFVLPEEQGINAFAAGYSMGDAVVAVSKGSLEYLTRDELQGVVAHEFSHILNGDMRLNIRLISIIFGITALVIVGRIVLYGAAYSGRSGGSSKRGDGRAALLLLGLGLMVLGFAGAFFGRLIQSAISRQREYLADASAVQFTRNPEGIAGALKKIGGLEIGSAIENPHAGEVSHMWISDAFMGRHFAGVFATHPPLDERIRRLDPHFDGNYPVVKPILVSLEEEKADQARNREKARRAKPGAPILPGAPPILPGAPPILPGGAPLPLPAEAIVLAEAATETPGARQAGKPGPQDGDWSSGMADAQELLASIPDELHEAAQEPFSARALVYCLLLDADASAREGQLAQLKGEADPRDYQETLRLMKFMDQLPEAARLPLLDLALPSLRQMSPAQHRTFRAQVEHLIEADKKVCLFEYTMRCILNRHLDEAFENKRTHTRRRSAGNLAEAMVKVLSLLALEGHDDFPAAEKAFQAGMRTFLDNDRHPYRLLSRDQCSLTEFDAALQILAGAVPQLKRRVMLACAACVLADQHVSVRESELLRAVGDMIGAPLPPLVVKQEQ